MSIRPRRVQNKPKRETNEIKQSELQEIRRENQKLRREIAKLRREVHKNTPNSPPEKEDEEETSKKFEKEQLCPECGSNQLSQIQFSVKVFTVCGKCKYRKAN